jgi:hypothetical protein
MALRACRSLIKAIEAIREYSDAKVDNFVEAFTMADEDEIMTHMMDCVALLAAMQSKMQQEVIPVNSMDARMSRNKVFMAALSVVGGSSLKIDKKEQQMQTKNAAIDQLLLAFPVPDQTYPVGNGRKGWLPLHWAVALMASDECNVTEADVKTLYELDPMAIQATHVDNDYYEEVYKGLTPVHLLCMSPATPCIMQLVRLISVCSPTAFKPKSTFSALHAACHYGTPTVELLEYILQLDSSQAKVPFYIDGENFEHCPLGQLCSNLMKRADELPNAVDLVNCLLEVDKSKDVVGDAVFGCLRGFGYADVKSEGEAMTASRKNGRLQLPILIQAELCPKCSICALGTLR